MPIYWVVNYDVKPDRHGDYQKWLNSNDARALFGQFEKETGAKYLNTYFPILGFGEYSCEDWFEVPNWAAVDKFRESKAFDEFVKKTWDLIDQTKAGKTRVMRTATDVRVYQP